MLTGKTIEIGDGGGINDTDGGMAGKGIKRICASERNLLAVGATLPLVFAFQLCERVWFLFAAYQGQDTDEHTEHYIIDHHRPDLHPSYGIYASVVSVRVLMGGYNFGILPAGVMALCEICCNEPWVVFMCFIVRYKRV